MGHRCLFFFYFSIFYKQLSVIMFNKSWRWLDVNSGSEATTLPTAPQPLPSLMRTKVISTNLDRKLVFLSLALGLALPIIEWWATSTKVLWYHQSYPALVRSFKTTKVFWFKKAESKRVKGESFTSSCRPFKAFNFVKVYYVTVIQMKFLYFFKTDP